MSERSTRPAQPVLLGRRTVHPADTIVRIGSIALGASHQPVVIAGLCSVESEHHIMEAARAAREAGVHLLRGGSGGAFEPRLSPSSFHGVGLPGLERLARAGAAVGLPVVTEVIEPERVPAVAELADAVQIGSRSRYCTRLLRAVGRCGRPVVLERGDTATLEEWLLAADCILAEGNPHVILCERGIQTFDPETPTLDLNSIPLVSLHTHLPIIVDPSHGTGRRELVLPMSLAAVAAGAHGLLIEMSLHPAEALSDREQAIDAATLRMIVRRVVLVQVAAQLPARRHTLPDRTPCDGSKAVSDVN